MLRRTKIIATLGPATDDPAVLEALFDVGLDAVRINLSHGSHAAHEQRIRQVREQSRKSARPVALLMDLQGPKIRIGRFGTGAVELVEGEAFCLDMACPLTAGDASRVGLTYPELIQDVAVDDLLLLDDGRIVLQIRQIQGSEIACTVVVGGTLSDSKGINRQGGGLSARRYQKKIGLISILPQRWRPTTWPSLLCVRRRMSRRRAGCCARPGVVAASLPR